jgi:natural product precursor
MKNQKQTSKLAAFAKEAIDKKQMKQVQGGGFWDWLGGGWGGTGGKA